MNARLQVVILVILSLAVTGAAQFPGTLVKQLREIKPLESTRYGLQQILYEYKASDVKDHHQVFSNDDVEIEVWYSTGKCSDPDDDDHRELWNVDEWRVVRIDVWPTNAIAIKDAGTDLSKFVKEQRYRDNTKNHIYHDKGLGWAFARTKDGIEEIILFPSKKDAKKLCEGDDREARAFYSRDSWFSVKLEERSGETYCPVASVHHVNLSVNEIAGATSDKTISVITNASDPENDVLTYVYIVSAGQIRGSGPRVIWDLTGVPAGSYTITAGVDDGCGLCGSTVTKTIVVR